MGVCGVNLAYRNVCTPDVITECLLYMFTENTYSWYVQIERAFMKLFSSNRFVYPTTDKVYAEKCSRISTVTYF